MHPTSHNPRHESEQVDIFLWNEIQHTNNSNKPINKTSTCGMKYHEKCHGIGYGSIIGRIIWEQTQSDIYKNCSSRNGKCTPTSTSGNRKTAANSIVNGIVKQEISRSIDMQFYWVHDRLEQNNLHIFWEGGKKNLADYVTKHHPKCP